MTDLAKRFGAVIGTVLVILLFILIAKWQLADSPEESADKALKLAVEQGKRAAEEEKKREKAEEKTTSTVVVMAPVGHPSKTGVIVDFTGGACAPEGNVLVHMSTGISYRDGPRMTVNHGRIPFGTVFRFESCEDEPVKVTCHGARKTATSS